MNCFYIWVSRIEEEKVRRDAKRQSLSLSNDTSLLNELDHYSVTSHSWQTEAVLLYRLRNTTEKERYTTPGATPPPPLPFLIAASSRRYALVMKARLAPSAGPVSKSKKKTPPNSSSSSSFLRLRTHTYGWISCGACASQYQGPVRE